VRIVPVPAGAFHYEGSLLMLWRLIETEQRDIDERIRVHGLDPGSFAYRVQASGIILRYVRTPPRVFGKQMPAEALALYPKGRKGLYMTFERDPQLGFRSSFKPALHHELSASVLTWEELMGILDLWLQRLVKDRDLLGRIAARPAPKEAHQRKISL
jgi:hypothetical protein